ncbi:tachylectin-2-like [Pelobates fuscus]|uniref:tachylectin-2-like n=1 Tax=Pelobates fuscus TaxID=191477 RepID=UPI002FE431FB
MSVRLPLTQKGCCLLCVVQSFSWELCLQIQTWTGSPLPRVGKTDWDGFKLMFFDPNGLLYAATKKGEFYKGPAPSNENVSWLYGQATKIGTNSWNEFDALFFDPKGILYAVTSDDKLVMRSPPTKPDDNWLDSSKTIGKGGWRILTHFMAFTLESDLWCVDSKNGNIYKGPTPTIADTNYIEKAQKLGWGYNVYPSFPSPLIKPSRVL